MASGSSNEMLDASRGRLGVLVQSHRSAAALTLLIALHAPTLWAYAGQLASREHYQFFPVIWIALLVLVVTRSSSALALRWYHWTLLLVDGLFVVAGSLYRSPWLSFAGFCAGCLAVLAAGRDKMTGRSLWPLALLPLITLRPPVNFDTQMITRLQLMTTQAASLVLGRSGMLHYRRGVVFAAAQVISLQPGLQAGPRSVGDDFFAKETLAGEYDGWKRGEFRTEVRSTDSMWGERSCIWDFSRGPRGAQVSVDYLFEGWHELVHCFQNTGWKVTSREIRRPDESPAPWPLVVALLQDDTGRHGVLCYSLFDRGGLPVMPAADELAAGLVNRRKRAAGRVGTYQVQAFAATLAPPGEDDIESLVRLHCQTRRDLARRFSGGADGS